ncbi:MAG: AlpA family phage regulatory protein [Rubrivivax sp.]|nr:AlpA family phage regulatory protein [Rubrivivax sp.]
MEHTKAVPHYVRLKQLIGDKKAKPPTRPKVPISGATVWRGVKSGTFPKPLKLGPRTSVWSMDVIEAWLKSHEEASA